MLFGAALLCFLCVLHPSPAAAVLVEYQGVVSSLAAQRENVIDAIGDETLPAGDPFIQSLYSTVAPGWSWVDIGFIAEGAGNENDFGWFLFDYDTTSGYTIVEGGALFTNIRETPYDELGNYTSPGLYNAVESGESFLLTAQDDDSTHYLGWWIRDPDNQVFYSVNELNPDAEDHFGAGLMTGGIAGYYMGIEDLYGLGDRDYNDVIFYANANTGLSPNPSVVPEPGSAALFVIGCLPILVLYCRRRHVSHAVAAACYRPA